MMNLFFRVLRPNGLYILKYFTFTVLSFSGLLRTFVFDIGELGLWREIASLVTLWPQILLLGIPGYLILSCTSVRSKYLFNCSVSLIVWFVLVVFLFSIFGYYILSIDMIFVLVSGLISLEVLFSSLIVRLSKIHWMLLVQVSIYSIEIVCLLVAYVADLEISRPIVYAWLSVRSLAISFSLVVLLFSKNQWRFMYVGVWRSLSFLKSQAPVSLKNNYFSMVASTALMNFDGLVFSRFLPSEEIGYFAIFVFFRSILITPLTLCGQKLSPILRNGTGVRERYGLECKKALFFTLLVIAPCFVVFYFLEKSRADIDGGYLYLLQIVAFSLLVTALGPVHTFLQAKKLGHIAFAIDMGLICVLIAGLVLIHEAEFYVLFSFYIIVHFFSYFLKWVYMRRLF